VTGLAENVESFGGLATFGPAFGGLRSYDVGKRIYRVGSVFQMENAEQLAARLRKEAP
jgi:hypothetical protein